MPDQPFLCHFIDKVEDVKIIDPLRDILAERSIPHKNSTKKKVLKMNHKDVLIVEELESNKTIEDFKDNISL